MELDDALFQSVKALCYKTGLVKTVMGYDPLLTKEDIDQIIYLSVVEAARNYNELKNLRTHTNRHKYRRKRAALRSVAYIYAQKNLFEAAEVRAEEIERFIIVGDHCKRIGEKEYLSKQKEYKKKFKNNGHQIISARIVKYMEDMKFEDSKKSADELLNCTDQDATEFLISNEKTKTPEELLIEKEKDKEDLFELFDPSVIGGEN